MCLQQTNTSTQLMIPLPYNTHKLTTWLRRRYPEVLEEYEAEKNAEWEKKVCEPFSVDVPINIGSKEGSKITHRVSYLKPGGEAYKFEEFKSPQPKRVQSIPTDDDYRNLIYLAEEMDLDEEVIKNMKEMKKKVQS